MHISIDTTDPVSDLDRSILTLIMGGELPQAAPEPVSKKTALARKPAPAPEPEPMAEEPLPEEEQEAEEDEVEEDDADEQSDEDLLALAVKKATEMVAGGDAAKVREALDAAGASRVRELNKENVREFFKALS